MVELNTPLNIDFSYKATIMNAAGITIVIPTQLGFEVSEFMSFEKVGSICMCIAEFCIEDCALW